MPKDDQLWTYSASELATGFGRGDYTPIDVLESVIARMEDINPRINAVVTTDLDTARVAAKASAQRWRNGCPSGALDGVPMTVKDNVPVAGMRATWGSELFSTYVPSEDELCVARLRAAGAVIVGKTNCPELTVQGYTDNAIFGLTRNPFDLDLTPGGSSGGAVAAVAAGICPIAIATDGGGSIRRPASYTGLIGMKPSRGRVARADGFAAILHDCEVVGPIARTVADVRRVMEIIGRPHFRDPMSVLLADEAYEAGRPKPCRILYLPEFGSSPVDRQIADSVARAADLLSSLGHRVEAGAVPFDIDALGMAWTTISQTGLTWLLKRHFSAGNRVGTDIQAMCEAGSRLRAEQYYEALAILAELKSTLAQLYEAYDMIMTPSAAAMPWPAGEAFPNIIDDQPVGPRGHAIFTGFVNMAGCAAINLPSVPNARGMPIGFQLVGPVGADKLLCDIGEQYESAFRPPRIWPLR